VLAALYFFVLPASTLFFVVLLIGWAFVWSLVFKKTKHKISFFLFVLLMFGSLWGALQFTPVQNWLTSKVTTQLSKYLKTTVSIKHIELSFFNKMSIEGLLLEDKKHDTLVYAGTAKVNITDWFFFKDNATLKYIGLSDAIVNINRTDSVWNYQFLIDYFSTPKKKPSGSGGIDFDLQVLQFNNVFFNKVDKWVGQDMTVAIKKLDLKADTIN
jgi:hypothetical protein